MNWFNDAKTTTKLFACFGLMALMLAVVGGVGLMSATETNASMVNAYDRDMKGLELALKVDVERLKVARSYRNGMLFQDDHQRETALHELDEEERHLMQLLAELQQKLVLQENIARVKRRRGPRPSSCASAATRSTPRRPTMTVRCAS